MRELGGAVVSIGGLSGHLSSDLKRPKKDADVERDSENSIDFVLVSFRFFQ